MVAALQPQGKNPLISGRPPGQPCFNSHLEFLAALTHPLSLRSQNNIDTWNGIEMLLCLLSIASKILKTEDPPPLSAAAQFSGCPARLKRASQGRSAQARFRFDHATPRRANFVLGNERISRCGLSTRRSSFILVKPRRRSLSHSFGSLLR
jgi:hypothetical protein